MLCGLIRNNKQKIKQHHILCLRFEDVLNVPSYYTLCDDNDYIRNNLYIQKYRDCASHCIIKYVANDQKTDTKLSILYSYYNARKIQGNIIQDIGASMESTCKSIIDYGYVHN